MYKNIELYLIAAILLFWVILVCGLALTSCGPTPVPQSAVAADEVVRDSRCHWEQQENAKVGAAGAVVRTYLLKCSGDYTGCMMTVWGTEHEVFCD